MKQENVNKRIETKDYIETFIAKVRYCMESGDCKISLQLGRKNEENKNIRFTNQYTLNELFPNEDPAVAMKRELVKLRVTEYIETLKDLNFSKKSELRVFGKKYTEDVYIKIRAELLSKAVVGNNMIFVLSFHFAEYPFTDSDFPYKK